MAGLSFLESGLSLLKKVFSYDVLPSADDSYDIGSSALQWKDIYIDGVAYIDTLNVEVKGLVADDILFALGTSSDGVLLNRSTVLNANTALSSVLIGTPVTPALAANSLIISNITADGDILIAANDGGHSRVALFFDSSAPNTTLYNVGGTWTAGASTWTIPAVTLGGTVTGGSQSIINIAEVAGAAGANLFITSTGAGNILFLDSELTAVNTNTAVLIRTFNGADSITDRLGITGGINTAVATWSNVTHTGLVLSGALLYGANQVVGARVVDARCDDSINSGDATTDGVIDALRDAMIAHGLISASA